MSLYSELGKYSIGALILIKCLYIHIVQPTRCTCFANYLFL